MRKKQDFTATIRDGRRTGRPAVVVHLAPSVDGARPVRVGVIVSRAVGSAVVRNRVKRRLRHLAADRLARLPDGSLMVLRATPAAATTSTSSLAAQLDGALTRLLTERSSGNGVRGAARGRRTSEQALSSAPGPPPEGAGGES